MLIVVVVIVIVVMIAIIIAIIIIVHNNGNIKVEERSGNEFANIASLISKSLTSVLLAGVTILLLLTTDYPRDSGDWL